MEEQVPDKAIWRVIIPWIFPVIFLAAFSLLALALAFSVGVGCADDAYHAVIAKNLAYGRGYTSTIQDGRADFIALQFDPRVGVGPTIILPASLVIRIFGNTYWAPGLAHVIVWSLLFIGIGLLMRNYQAGIGFSLAALSFLYLSYALMTFHYEQWYALLGEMPAALLIILSILLFFHNGSRPAQLCAGIAMALAVQAKLLSLLAFAVFLVAAAWYTPDQSQKASDRLKETLPKVICLLIGFIIPLLAFETWKFLELGPAGYMNNWKSHLSFVINQGTDRGRTLSLFTLYKTRTAIVYESFGVAFHSLAFLLMLVGVLVNKDKKMKAIYFVFISMICLYSFWWIFFSLGWARYYIIPLILIVAVASLPFFASYPRKWLWCYFILIVIWPAGTWDRIAYPFSMMDSGYFKPTKRTEALLKTSNILSGAERKDKVLTQWWATAANLEYISGSHLIFTTYRDKTRKPATPYWVAGDTKFIDPNDKDFNEMLNHCKGLRKVGDYVAGRCE